MLRLPRQILDYGPDALLLNWEQRIDSGISSAVHAYANLLSEHPAVAECIPAYASLLVRFFPPKITAYALREDIYSLEPSIEGDENSLLQEIPVCYHPDVAPDLVTVAEKLGISQKVLIKLHTSVEYQVYQLGFRPGFGFLGETDKRLKVARRSSPRRSVPAGSVGIAGQQTGIYPSESPGGWQLIGRTPWPMLREGRDISRLRPGDRVIFKSISLTAYEKALKTTAPWPKR